MQLYRVISIVRLLGNGWVAAIEWRCVARIAKGDRHYRTAVSADSVVTDFDSLSGDERRTAQECVDELLLSEEASSLRDYLWERKKWRTVIKRVRLPIRVVRPSLVALDEARPPLAASNEIMDLSEFLREDPPLNAGYVGCIRFEHRGDLSDDGI